MQLVESRGTGDGADSWYRTRRYIDHAGLEAMLRDFEERPWARNIIRDLVAFVASSADSDSMPSIDLDPKLDTEKKIRKRMRRLGVVRWM